MPEALSSWAAEKPLGISAVFWTGAALTLALALLLRFSAAGRRFQAVGANPRAAWMAGLRVRTHVVFAYTAAGILYAIAAILLAGIRINIDPGFGAAYLLAPIAAVVIAGASLVRRAGERDVDVGGGARAHLPDADAADPGPVGGDAVHRLRRGDHRRDAGLR